MATLAAKVCGQGQSFSFEDDNAVGNWLSSLQFPHNCHSSILRTHHGTVIGPLPIHNLKSPCSPSLLDGLLIVREAPACSDAQAKSTDSSVVNSAPPNNKPPPSSCSSSLLDNGPLGTFLAAAYDFRRFLPEGYQSDTEEIRSTSPPPPLCNDSCRCACHFDAQSAPILVITTAPTYPSSRPTSTESRAHSAPPSQAFPPTAQAQSKSKSETAPSQPPRSPSLSPPSKPLNPPPFPPVSQPRPRPNFSIPDDPSFTPSLSSAHPLCPLELEAWKQAIRSLDSYSSDGRSEDFGPSPSASASAEDSDGYSPPSAVASSSRHDSGSEGEDEDGEEDEDDYDPEQAFNPPHTSTITGKLTKRKKTETKTIRRKSGSESESSYDPEAAFNAHVDNIERERKKREGRRKRDLRRVWEEMLEQEIRERGVEVRSGDEWRVEYGYGDGDGEKGGGGWGGGWGWGRR